MKTKQFLLALTSCVMLASGAALAASETPVPATEGPVTEAWAKEQKVSDYIDPEGRILDPGAMTAKGEALGDSGLVRAGSYAELLSALVKMNAFYVPSPPLPEGEIVATPDTTIVIPKTDGPDLSSVSEFSSTNVQVGGIDEPDVIKTDGKTIYYANDGKVFVFSAGERPRHLSTLNVDDNHTVSNIYLSGDTLVICGSGLRNFETLSDESEPNHYWNWLTCYWIFNVKNPSEPKFVRALSFEGAEQDSRLLDGRVYFVTRESRDRLPYAECALNHVAPAYSDTEVGETWLFLKPENIYYNPDETYPSLTMQGCFEIKEGGALHLSAIYDASGMFYMNQDSMYVAGNDWRTREKGTAIHRYDITNEGLTYAASANVKGYPLNQYSMDEYNGVFRIAMSDNSRSGDNTLYTFDAVTLKKQGQVSMAKGESIFAVRYIGDTAYIVTYEVTDPLFVIDLKDPKRPKVLGELKIPGFSDYLHPLKDGYLIGFGREETELGYLDESGEFIGVGQFEDIGMKLSLFDVTDPENPKETHKYVIHDSYEHEDITSRDIMVDAEKSLFAFPQTFEYLRDNRWIFLNYGVIFYADEKDGFKQLLRVEHPGIEHIYPNEMRFSYIDNVLYFFAKDRVYTYDYTTMKKISELNFG